MSSLKPVFIFPRAFTQEAIIDGIIPLDVLISERGVGYVRFTLLNFLDPSFLL